MMLYSLLSCTFITRYNFVIFIMPMPHPVKPQINPIRGSDSIKDVKADIL